MLQEQSIGVIVARGFLLGHSKRQIHAVFGVNLPVETCLGVEEIERLVDVEGLQALGVGGPIPLVVIARDAVADVAILQVGIGTQAASDHVISLDVNIEIGLAAIVAVILVVRVQRVGVILHPNDLAKVVVTVTVDAAAQRGIQPVTAILQRENTAAKAAIDAFLAHQARFLDSALGRHHGQQSILLERAGILVFLIVAVAIGIMQGHIEFPQGIKRLIPNQLVVGLAIDILLVLVKARHLAVVLDFAIWVVGAVLLQVIAADAVPSVVGILLAAKSDESHRCAVVKITHLAKVAHQFAAGTVTVTIATDVRQARLKCPMIAHQATTQTQGLLICII